MSPFAALKRFFSSKVDGHAPMDDAFVQIVREGWIDALKLRERGEEQGTMNLPRTDASTLDVVEHEVAERVGEELNAAQIAARNNTQSYENRLAALQLLHELGAIQAATTTAIGDFETLVDNYLPKPAIDRTTIRMAELLKSRWGTGKTDAAKNEETQDGAGQTSQ